MQIRNVCIENFRGIKYLSLDLDDVTVIVGENNSGKSTVLEAIRICLSGRYTFGEYDCHLGNGIETLPEAKPIEITITFSEKTQDEWSDKILQILDDIVQLDVDDLKKITLRVKSEYDSGEFRLKSEWQFLNIAKKPLAPKKSIPSIIRELNKIVPIFYLSSTRDPKHYFTSSSEFWKPFIQPVETDVAKRIEIETKLQKINSEILDVHADFSDIKLRLKQAAKIVDVANEDKSISIETIPSKIVNILKNTRVYIMSRTNAIIPMTSHGQGTQSISVFLLFIEFIKNKLSTEYHELAEPVFAIEEPEAHLHPSACGSIAEMLSSSDFKGQKIITTHSGDFLAGVELYSIRRINCKNGETNIFRIEPGSIDTKTINKMDFRIRYTRGNLLFARCWLLVEGPTECILFPEFARSIGKNFFANGVHCVDFAEIDIDKVIKIANALGIDWIVFTDNDTEGNKYKKRAKKYLGTRQCNDYIFDTIDCDIEELLKKNGFSAIYDGISSEKIRNAIKVVECIHQGGASIPESLKKVINRACEIGRNV